MSDPTVGAIDGPGQAATGPARPRRGAGGFVRRHPLLSGLAALVLLGALALPVVAYVVVPSLVRSTLVEDLPRDQGGSGTPTADTIRRGALVRISAADYGSGTVRIVSIGAERFLRFENVDIAGAPDMYVYLSDRIDGRPGTFTDLGRLKATNGSFNYSIPAVIDLTNVRAVVVWCRQFTVTVTYAVLE